MHYVWNIYIYQNLKECLQLGVVAFFAGSTIKVRWIR